MDKITLFSYEITLIFQLMQLYNLHSQLRLVFEMNKCISKFQLHLVNLPCINDLLINDLP